MILENHIAYRFLRDDTLMWEMIETTHPAEWKNAGKKNLSDGTVDTSVSKMASYYDLIRPEHNKTYYITNTVLENLELLKLDVKENGHYDWSVFNKLEIMSKYTFIFPDNHLIRMKVYENAITFCDLRFIFKDKKKGTGQSLWENFYIERETGALCDHFESDAMKYIEKFVYSFLCFMFLTDNDEIILQPKQQSGTKKTGKIINSLLVPLTIVNSRWNTTVIRSEKFGVRGHFRLQRYGSGRMQAKLIFIEPFEKQGYTRKAKSKLQ